MAAVTSCKTKDRYSTANYMKSKMSNLYTYEREGLSVLLAKMQSRTIV